MSVPNQIPKLDFSSLDPAFNIHYSQLCDRVNSLLGHSGTIELGNHLSLGGKRIMNVAPPVSPTDALSSAVAEASYSAPALKPKLQPGGPASMPGYRQIGSGSQREPSSSYLNDLMSSVPSANEIYPTLTTVGSSVDVSIPASIFTFADGSSTMLNARTDTLTIPMQYAISTISAASGIVTLVTTAPSGLVAGQVVTIAGVAATGFNGTFTLTGSAPPYGLTYQDGAAGGSSTGGYVQVNGIYYYAVKKRSQSILLFGPYSGDTALNRLQVNYDGSQILAVVAITASGGQIALSGGGGSPIVGAPAAGAFF